MKNNIKTESEDDFEKKSTLKIHTPEGIVFSLHLAGPFTRFLAWLIDLACVMVVSNVLNTLIGFLGVVSPDIVNGLRILSYFITSIAYGIVLEWYWNGQTVGKKMLRLRVVDVQGLSLKSSQIIMRNLLRCVDALPLLYMAGGISMLLTLKAQRIGDIAANTIVIRNPVVNDPDFSQLLSDKFNSFRNYPHIGARLRQKASPEEADLALQALLRRERLSPIERIHLFKQLAEHFKTIVVFPQECTDGMSDEQYTRNVVDILYRMK